MPPAKRKAEQGEEATAPPPRVTRASAKRSAAVSSEPQPDSELPEKKKAKKAKGTKQKKEKGEGVSVQSDAKAEEGDASGNVLEAFYKTIVVEHCKQCRSFKVRAELVKEGLEKAGCGVTVILNPEKPRRGCFEIRRQQGGMKFISLLDMKRPFKPMKDLDMDKVISDVINEISKTS